MYCPNCKQNFEGKFCPECGTELIEEPVSGVNINLGDANAISGGVNVHTTNNVENKTFDNSVTNIDNSVHNTTQNIDNSVHNTTQNVTHNITNITQVAATEADVERAAEKAKAALAEADKQRSEAELMKELRYEKERQELAKKNKRRTYIVSSIVFVILASAMAAIYLYFWTGKSVAEIASEAAYNSINSVSINDIEVDTDDIPSDDPSVKIDPKGDIKKQLEEHYQSVISQPDGFYKLKDNNLYGLADPKGKVIQRPKYTQILTRNSKGLIPVKKGNCLGFLNMKGVEVVPPIYDKIEEPADGMIRVQKNSLWGFLDANSLQEVAPCIYTYIYSKENDKFKVKIGAKIGYLNADGSVYQSPE